MRQKTRKLVNLRNWKNGSKHHDDTYAFSRSQKETAVQVEVSESEHVPPALMTGVLIASGTLLTFLWIASRDIPLRAEPCSPLSTPLMLLTYT